MLSKIGLENLSSPSSLADDDDKQREHDAIREALQRGEALPLVRILAIAQQAVPGDVIEVELERKRSGLIYEIKVLTGTGRVREVKIDARTGVISTVAGVCRYGYDGDNKPATRAMLHAPEGVLFDRDDNIYVSDTMNHRIRKVDAGTGMITTVAGNGDSGQTVQVTVTPITMTPSGRVEGTPVTVSRVIA